MTAKTQRFGGTQLAILGSLLVAIALLVVSSPGVSKEPEESEVEQKMRAAHKGEKDKRDAPLELIQDEVKRDNPDWALLAKNTKPLAELSLLIKDNVNYTSQPGPYIASVKALAVATEAKDLTKARAAVAGLMKSCAGCHRE